jgi:hypothetical protein
MPPTPNHAAHAAHAEPRRTTPPTPRTHAGRGHLTPPPHRTTRALATTAHRHPPPPATTARHHRATLLWGLSQVPLQACLTKFDGQTEQEMMNGDKRQYVITKLPKYLIVHIKRFSQNTQQFAEKNPTVSQLPRLG